MVNLGTSKGGGSDAQGDIYYDIEHIIGSAFDDILIGSGDVNIIHGGGGDDQIFGLGDDDFLDGGEGADYLDGGDGYDMARLPRQRQRHHGEPDDRNRHRRRS